MHPGVFPVNILLNGQKLDVDGITPEVTLAELVDLISAELKDSGAAVMEIVADNERLTPDQIDILQAHKLVEYGNVEILTATARDLLEMALEEGSDVFDFIDEQAQSVASDLRIGKVKEAMEHQLETLDGLEWLSSILKNLASGFAAEMSERSIEPSRKQLLDRLTTQMSALQKAHENNDWVGLADILEYELPEIISQARELFDELRALMPEKDEPGADA